MNINLITDPLIIIGGAIARSVIGWAKKALEDKKVTPFEWKLLGSTVFRVGAITAAGYYGFSFAGVDIPVVAAACGGYVVDVVLRAIKR